MCRRSWLPGTGVFDTGQGRKTDAAGVDQAAREHGFPERDVLLPIRHELGHHAVARLQKRSLSATSGLVRPGHNTSTPTLGEHRGSHADPLCVNTIHLVERGEFDRAVAGVSLVLVDPNDSASPCFATCCRAVSTAVGMSRVRYVPE
jgi:hypothetical protein